ncbi:hypothetical protein Pla100_26760 [Neorhodopirellula pilleata]|uniref:Uncharacterized protein n=2 Tax=Neorhodopirellula pilleata TaxID=2714738 RepID=A0A5C6ABU9_9BACT|nr:hypothetical protein Pla100_26760 [Neorhodopirellula pilleata]
MRHNVSSCPICGGGLCGVRAYFDASGVLTHGLVVCDECEAIWLQPDTGGVHVYADPESPRCPISGVELYHRGTSRWANEDDLASLGWSAAIASELTFECSEGRHDGTC